MLLDVRTLILVSATISLLAAVALAALAWATRCRGLGHWTASAVCVGTGFMLVALRPVLPDWLSVIAANGLFLASAIQAWLGARAFTTQQPVSPYWVLAGVLPFLPLLSVIHGYGDIMARTLLIQAALAIPVFGTGVELVRHGGDRLILRNLLALIVFGHAVVLLARVILAPMLEARQLFQGGPAIELFMLETALYIPVCIVFYAGMVAERAMRTVRQRALFDAVGGHFNAAGFAMMMEKELSRGRRESTPMALIVAGFDRSVAAAPLSRSPGTEEAEARFRAICRQTLREQDTLGRLEDGRYAVILPNTHLEDGLRIAQRLRSAFASGRSSHGPAPIRSLSLGTASAIAGIATPDSVMAAAAEAQERAATEGGDRVERAATPLPVPLGSY